MSDLRIKCRDERQAEHLQRLVNNHMEAAQAYEMAIQEYWDNNLPSGPSEDDLGFVAEAVGVHASEHLFDAAGNGIDVRGLDTSGIPLDIWDRQVMEFAAIVEKHARNRMDMIVNLALEYSA